MRSCVGIVDVKDYSTEVIDTVCNRYLWEILALPVKTPLIVGGTCQGGILALELARRLQQIGRTPLLLILMEWRFSYGHYAGHTLLLYGNQSYVAEIYLNSELRSPNWREDFPCNTVAAIPGTHGSLFEDSNVTGLAKAITGALRQCQQRLETNFEAQSAFMITVKSASQSVVAMLARELACVKLSTTWKLTALRKWGARFPWITGQIRGLPRLLWRSFLADTHAHERWEIQSIKFSSFFDQDWYYQQYPDVCSAGLDAAVHYLRHGAGEGRDPVPLFDSDWYLNQNPDVAKSDINPLVHYLKHGVVEGRSPKPETIPFAYWDKADHTVLAPFISEWLAEFPKFRVLGDRDIEPIINRIHPAHADIYRRILIPAAKSDIARLVALFEFGGLYIDCHCGLRDRSALTRLLDRLDNFEVVLWERSFIRLPSSKGRDTTDQRHYYRTASL